MDSLAKFSDMTKIGSAAVFCKQGLNGNILPNLVTLFGLADRGVSIRILLFG
jgi:hypothetical protein